jgi:hypothetical protein
MVASELVESAMVPPDNEDGERTISDLATGEDDLEGMVVESIDEDGILEEDTAQPREALLEAVTHLRAIKKLNGSANVRAALPAAALLEEKSAWTTQRVRALAVKCDFEPPLGITRRVLLQMIEDFRLRREGGVLEEEPLQDAPPDTIVLDGDGDDELELAILRELEETELLVLIEESDRGNELAAEFAAAKKRKQGGE